MKKILLLILTLSLFTFACSCNDEIDLTTYLSQKRTTVYVCEENDFKLTVFAEERETPFLTDGFVGKVGKFVTVKIENFTTSLDDVSVTLNYGKNSVNGKLDFNPINGKFSTEICVETLPNDDEISLTVANAGEQKNLTLKKFKSEGVDYVEALSAVSKHAKESIESLLKAGESIEVRLRLIPEGDRYYYYVSITDNSKKTIAFLVDGVTAKILASRVL